LTTSTASQARDPGRGRASGCLLLVFLPFLLGGIGGAAIFGQHLIGWFGARSLVAAECVIARAELRIVGSDGPGYEVHADYRYTVAGHDYLGHRVHFGWGFDSGEFHPRLFEELERHRTAGLPYPCFVDPTDPTVSLLNRDFRFDVVGLSAVFVVIFGGVAAFGMKAAFSGARRRSDFP
jgi:Protein of unknown function (DUF3592)